MKKKIFISILILLTGILCPGFAFSFVEEEPEMPKINVEELVSFEDKNIKNYTLMDLQMKIIEYQNKQNSAHEITQSAKALGWPENCEPVVMAQIEWRNAKLIVEYYQKIYEEKLAKIEKEKWEKRMDEYPEATEAWLYMKEQGWNDYVCAGIMGNLMAETGGQTLNLNPKLYCQGYYGICQWNKNHKSAIWGKGLTKQLEYMNSNIKSEIDTYGYAYKKGFKFDTFLNLTNEKEAALAFAKSYERCASSTYEVRQKNATKAYDYFVK